MDKEFRNIGIMLIPLWTCALILLPISIIMGGFMFFISLASTVCWWVIYIAYLDEKKEHELMLKENREHMEKMENLTKL